MQIKPDIKWKRVEGSDPHVSQHMNFSVIKKIISMLFKEI